MSKFYGGLTPQQLVAQNQLVFRVPMPPDYLAEGLCYERATFYRQVIGKGSVITFSLMDYSVQHNCNHFNMPLFRVPHSEQYNGTVDWGHHSVFEWNGIVYSYELPNGFCILKDYIKELHRLNPNRKIYQRYEKQRNYTGHMN